MQLETSITTSQLALTAGVLLVAYVVITALVLPYFSEAEKYLRSAPWVGVQKEWFPRFRAGARFLFESKDMLSEGYEKYTKQGKTWVLPQFSTEPVTVLTAEQHGELLNLSDDQVDAHGPNSESIATPYTTGADVSDGPHIDVVRRQLTRRLPLLTPFVYEELVFSMRDQWKANEDTWTTVKAYPTCMKIVSRAANRVFSGTELCRTPEFLDCSRLYTQEVFKAGGMIRLWPKWMHPVVGPWYTREMRKHQEVCRKYAMPIMEKRLELIRNPPTDPNYKAPLDAMQWMLEDIVKLSAKDPSQLEPSRLLRRLLILNMVAIHTTSMVTTNVLLDLYSSPDRDMYVAGLREEVERVLRESGGEWSKNAINSMHRIDSTIRESMRFGLGDFGMKRAITAPEGVSLQGGVFLPQGTRTAAPSHNIHMDPTFYGDNAANWDGFRFSRPREAYLERVGATGGDPDRLKAVLEQKNQGLIATGEDFLSFGHGRHACPGRFFASQEMKLMLAHIVMTYDIKVDGGRPPNLGINGARFPDEKAEIQIKLLRNGGMLAGLTA